LSFARVNLALCVTSGTHGQLLYVLKTMTREQSRPVREQGFSEKVVLSNEGFAQK